MSHGGMDMGNGSSGSIAMSSMSMGILHSALGIDTLWFAGWLPTSKGATAGSAIGLFALAVLSRFLLAIRTGLESSWRHDTSPVQLNESTPMSRSDSNSSDSLDKQTIDGVKTLDKVKQDVVQVKRLVPQFILGRELARGAMHTFSAFISYLLMLAVMTGNCWWFIGILLGLGFGEVLFGRHIAAMSHAP